MSDAPTTFDDLLAASVELAFHSTVLRLQTQIQKPSSTAALTDAHAHVSDVVARTMALILRRANVNAHFTMRLPPELFAAVLTHLGVHDRFNASGVCARWRAVALSFPRVWVDLGDYGLANPRLALALARGRAVPVDLSLMVRSGESGRILPHIRNHLHRVRTLQISIAEVWRDELCDALAAPAPLLRHLSIRLHGAYGQVGPRLRENVFAGYAPRLRNLTLVHVTPPLGTTPGLAEVESLRIVAQYARPVECALFLSATPKLQDLALDLISDALPSPTIDPAPPAPTLRSLYLVRCTGSLLAALPHASCGKVLIDHCDTSAIWALLHGLGAGLRLALLQNRERDYSPYRTVVRAADAAGRARAARCWSHTSLAEVFTPHVAAHLVSLATEAHLWHAPWTRVPLPRLEELHLLLRVAAGGGATERLPLCFTAPNLQTVRLSANPAASASLASALGWAAGEADAFMRALAPVGAVNVHLDGISERFSAEGVVVHHSSTSDSASILACPEDLLRPASYPPTLDSF